MIEVLFLGTSASAPSAQRGLSALIVKHNDLHFLVDCGEGTTRQIRKSETEFEKIKRILLTHGHLDHILGLGGLVGAFRHDEPIKELEIFGGKYTLERVRPLVNDVVLRGQQAPMPLHFREIVPGTFFEADHLRVTAFPVTHRGVDCLGYLFEEKDRRASSGDKRGPLQKGAKLAIVGDTGRTDNLVETVRDADALVIESTYVDKEVDMARGFSHLTARDAAELAVRAGIKQLILTHISRRYRAKDVLAQARSVFPNTVVARDFDNFQIGGDPA
ncbi:MAG TPA: ribonuclease Z [Anaerolineales bacterium]|nr:ribonuclease Z [Anaerolineales bacterium]